MNQGLTACRIGRGNYGYESMLGTVGFDSGRHYWEVKLDEFGDLQDIYIGICKKEHNGQPQNLNQHLFGIADTWGWICTGNEKRGAGVPSGKQNYGDYSKINEDIGVLLEQDLGNQGFGKLTFFRNGLSLGEAFDKIPPGCYYPCVSLFMSEGVRVQVTLNPKAKLPADAARYSLNNRKIEMSAQ